MALVAVAMAGTVGLSACGSGSDADQRNVLTWYTNPDGAVDEEGKANQAILAQKCTEEAGGEYSIQTQSLPRDASEQRQQLLRRLAAGDPGTDIMSMDPVFVAEFAEAGFLAEVPQESRDALTQDAVSSILEVSTWKDKLIGAPMWANTQLLWYRKSVAQEAGLDMSGAVTWDQIIDAAQQTDTTIGVQARRYEGYAVWINALVEGAGGHIVKNPEATGSDIQLGLEDQAGQEAARIIKKVADTGVAGPAMSSTNEETSLNQFTTEGSGFMLNWPYVWASPQMAGIQDDVAWTRYPQTIQGQESKPPLGGIILGVNSKSDNAPASWKAIQCITKKEHQIQYMLGTGNPAANKSAYDDPRVVEAFPMAKALRESLDSGAPRPVTQYYGDISTALQRVFSPPNEISPQSTPTEATQLIKDVLNGEALL
ncbi:extracellular solute-binding protein [Mobilicoccus caccae]|uniref:Trehalose-binding lipoprotein LpqY n=1 Tax=Mobilicoccus caccae TaxID=1859295 RepID=A0ABQ6IRG0_9MICO|nr:extracellular solute-binding protein [Mobilicoccus caccae]GMA40520.1 trehalose-binding lipoprotein LpqY [Mobilicoccus caccae]